MSKRPRLKLVQADTQDDVNRRIQAATAEFNALLQRHRVTYYVEQGQNNLTGQFTRVGFCVEVPKAAAAPDPVTNAKVPA